MKSLFICGTPLQSLIIKEIIRKNNLSRKDCSLFFYSEKDNDKFLYYYKNLSKLFHNHVYFVEEKNKIKSLLEARNIIKTFTYTDIYLASLVKIYSYIPLGLGKHDRIYTFDDGSANIFTNSSYYKKYGLSWKKWLFMISTSNFYHAERIRRESVAHYTLYPGFKNIVSKNVYEISPFMPTGKSKNDNLCAVILGTTFEAFFSQARLIEVYAKLGEVASRYQENAFYIPHPRSSVVEIPGITSISCQKIAEEIVFDLREKFGKIHIFGFCSSTQFNLLGIDGIKNYFLRTPETEESINQTRKLLSIAGKDIFVIDV